MTNKKGNVAIAVSLNIDFKNLPEIIPKCFLGAPWRCPGTSPEPPGARSSPLFRQSEESKTNWNASGRLPGRPGRPPEIQGGPENRQRINFRWKKRLPELFLYAFLLHFLHFFKIPMFFSGHFYRFHVFSMLFSVMQASRNTVIYIGSSTFQLFIFYGQTFNTNLKNT